MTIPRDILDQWEDQKSDYLLLIAWWEKKRWWYNVLVGITGLVVLAISGILKQLTLSHWIAIIVYGIMANVCFTMGWASALIAKYYWHSTLLIQYRNVLYFIGTVGSILLTYWIARVIVFTWLFGQV